MPEQLLSTDPQAGQLLSADPSAGTIVPDFKTTNEPPSTALKAAASGKNALQAALDALPGAGAIVGGALATPETLGAGTLVGAAIGAGAGRGLRDLVAQGLGLERPTSAIAKGGAIAMDAGETYLAGKILPALWEVIKAPGATVGDVIDQTKTLYKALPKAAKAFLPDFEALAKLPKGVAKAPAAILERPAWQTWEDHLPNAQPPPPAPGASMPGYPRAGTTPAPNPSPTPPAPTEFEAARAARQASTAPANSLPDQKALNEAALQARREAYAASQASATVPPPNGPVVKASGQMKLTGPEFLKFQEAVKGGASYPAAYQQLMAQRLADAVGGTMTDADVAAERAARVGNRSPNR